jgi:hypothetical protein
MLAEAVAEQIQQILVMEVLEVLAVAAREVKGRRRQQMELQILEEVVAEVLTLVEPHPTRHSVERVVQV